MYSDTRREQKFRPSLLHIDTQSILHPVSNVDEFKNERLIQLHKVLNYLKHTYPSWPIYWTTIETTTVIDSDKEIYARYTDSQDLDSNAPQLLLNNEAHLSLQRSIKDSKDLTDRIKFVSDTCDKFISTLASRINSAITREEDKIKYVFTGSTATQLANDLMVEVILGRGSTIRSTVGVCDNRHEIPVMRPLRDFSKKEIAYYLNARKIEPIMQPNMLTAVDQKSSIQAATESFLNKLYVNYPSTYSTLLKTGNKML